MCTGLDLCDRDQLHPCHENQGKLVGDRADDKRNHEVVKNTESLKGSEVATCPVNSFKKKNIQQRQRSLVTFSEGI